jgi:hypothetical protein
LISPRAKRLPARLIALSSFPCEAYSMATAASAPIGELGLVEESLGRTGKPLD